MRWWRRLGLRGRLMLVGTGGVVLGLAIGSVAIVVAMSYALQRTVDDSADATATSIASMIQEDGEVPRPIPVPAGQIAKWLEPPHCAWCRLDRAYVRQACSAPCAKASVDCSQPTGRAFAAQ